MIDSNVSITSLFTRKNHHQIMGGATMLANIPWVVSDIEEDDENEKKSFHFPWCDAHPVVAKMGCFLSRDFQIQVLVPLIRSLFG